MRMVRPRLAAPGRRARRLALAGSALAALLVSAAVVWHAAYATFAVTSPTYALSWGTGALAIGDDDAGTALFSVSGLAPGAAGTRCLAVTSTGNVPATIRLYAPGHSTSTLSSAITIAVVSGTGGSKASCSDFSPGATVYRGSLTGFPTSYATGVGSWTTAGDPAGETTTYQVTYSVPSNASTGAQGGSASVAFTWEARTTGGVK